jgi:competence protein ComEC
MKGHCVPGNGRNKFEGAAAILLLNSASRAGGDSPMPAVRSLRAPLLWLLLPFMGGLVVGDWRPLDAAAIRVVLAIAVALLGLAWWLQRGKAAIKDTSWAGGVLATAFISGWAWLPLRAPPPAVWKGPSREVNVVLAIEQLYAPAPGRKTFTGLARVVSGEGPASSLTGQRVYFAAIRRISTAPEASGHYAFRGVIEPVPRTESHSRGFQRHLASLGVGLRLMRGQMGAEVAPPKPFLRFCARAQHRLASLLQHGLESHPEVVSLYQAMLLGEKAVLSSEQQSAFMRSGVFHIFSISGLHVGVIAAAILAALTLLRVPRRVASVAGLAVLWLYVQVTGASTPAERAFLMIAFFVSSRVFRLPGNPLAALAGAALTTLLLDPRQLFTTGFQMSYTVVTALVVMGGPLADRWRAAWQPWADLPPANWGVARRVAAWSGHHFLAALAITCAAIIASTPSSIANFGLFSPGALLGNLIVVPLASLGIIAGFVSLLFGLCGLMPLCVLVNHAAAVVIVAMDALVQRGTAVPGVYFEATFSQPWMGPAAVAVVTGTFLVAGARRDGLHFWWPVVALTLVIIFGVKFG